MGFFSFSVRDTLVEQMVSIDETETLTAAVQSCLLCVSIVLSLGCLSLGCGVQERGAVTSDCRSGFCTVFGPRDLSCEEAPSIKHIIRNGLVNCVQLLNMFYIFICLL